MIDEEELDKCQARDRAVDRAAIAMKEARASKGSVTEYAQRDDTETCPKCQRIRNDFDCAEDNCPMAAPVAGDVMTDPFQHQRS